MIFSIIIPVYKVEKYLPECLDSVLGQSFSDFELILVDDGSPDRCPMICDDYANKDKRVKVIHQKNAGQASARNAGVELAKGDYIIYIDSDDYFADKTAFEKITQKISSGADVVLYGYRKWYESDGSFGAAVCRFPEFDVHTEPSKVISSLLINETYDGCAWTKAIKRSLCEKHVIHFRPGMISEDSDWYLNVMCHAKTYDHIDEPFVVYRQRAGSTSHAAKINSLVDNIWIQETWRTRISESSMSEDMKAALYSVLAFYYSNLLVLFSGYPKEQAKPFFDRVRSCKTILRYSITKRAKIMKVFLSIFGLRITVVLLRILGRIKKRQ